DVQPSEFGEVAESLRANRRRFDAAHRGHAGECSPAIWWKRRQPISELFDFKRGEANVTAKNRLIALERQEVFDDMERRGATAPGIDAKRRSVAKGSIIGARGVEGEERQHHRAQARILHDK